MSVRVRFAPSPTGDLHLGGARTALFNWLFARHNKGTFILRIEDTDKQRSTEQSIKAILDGMNWLGMDWDEGPGVGGGFGPYFQAERIDLYKKHIDILLSEGKAYCCFCTQEELDKKRKEAAERKEAPKYDGSCRKLSKEETDKKIKEGIPYVVRFKMSYGGKTEFEDMIRGKVSFENDVLDDFVILKSDGFPTYNFAAAIDDYTMKITHIIRGDDHISNTPRQIVLYKAFGFPLPEFAHIPMILGKDKARLSKRHGATSVVAYDDLGYLPDAMFNYLARLGWGYKDQEIFSKEELIEKFSLKGVSKNPAIFDDDKLNWLNSQYIKALSSQKLFEICYPIVKKAYGDQDLAYAEKVVFLFSDRLKTIKEIEGLCSYFFDENYPFDDKAKKYLSDPQAKELVFEFQKNIAAIKDFSKSEIEKVFKDFAKEKEIKLGVIIHPCRAALTGRAESPGIYDLFEVLGKERVLKRLASAFKF